MSENTQNPNNNQNMVNIGGLWLNKSKNGEYYFSGYLNGARLLIFKNQYKEKDSHPDYVMYVTRNNNNSEKASASDFESTFGDSIPSEPNEDEMKDIPF